MVMMAFVFLNLARLPVLLEVGVIEATRKTIGPSGKPKWPTWPAREFNPKRKHGHYVLHVRGN
jgi:hypothetical protein